MSENPGTHIETPARTDGPWVVVEERAERFVVSAPHMDEVVCRIEPWGREADLADAHLIAAAPDMLAALYSLKVLIEDQFCNPQDEPEGEWLDAVAREPHAALCAAIAKAEAGK